MWKVGDKLYCHKKAYNAIGSEIFKKGKYYTIDNINEYNTVYLMADDGHRLYGCKYLHVGDFFMTLSEHRKLKLKKINEA